MRDDSTFNLDPFFIGNKGAKRLERRFKKGYDALERVKFILNEVYKKSETQFIKDFVNTVYRVLHNEASIEELRPFYKKYNIIAGYYPKAPEAYAEYRALDDVIEVKFNTRDFDKTEAVNMIRELYVHEDTHRQQALGSILSQKDAQKPNLYDPWNLKDSENIAYFNQIEEADAYGRQTGERLRILYPEKDPEEILELIFDNRIDTYTKYMENLKVYRDQRIKKKARQHFFRALYDYLSEQEGENSLKALWENTRICAFQDFNVAAVRQG